MKKIIILLSTLLLSTTTGLNLNNNSYNIKTKKNTNDDRTLDHFNLVHSIDSLNLETKKNTNYDPNFDPTTSNFNLMNSIDSWNSFNIENNNININYNVINNTNDPEIRKWTLLNNICWGIDFKYKELEQKEFNTNEYLLTLLSSDHNIYNNLIYFTILNQSSNSSEPTNTNKWDFSSLFYVKNNDIKSYNLRISNDSCMDWNVNTSYFDVSVNICNFDDISPRTLASRQDDLNTSMLPDTNQTSTSYNSEGVEVNDTESYIENDYSSHKSYSLSKYYSNQMPFSTNANNPNNPIEMVNWKGDPNSINTPGHIDLKKICPEFNTYDTARFFLSNISIGSGIGLEDWCTPNSNSHNNDHPNEVKTFNIASYNNSGTRFLNKTDLGNGSLPWNETPDANIKNNPYYLSNSQYDHTFKQHWFQKTAGHIYYAGFLFLEENPNMNVTDSNNYTPLDIDAVAAFSSELKGTVYAGIKLKFSIHSYEIDYNFNSDIFANAPI